MPSPSKKHPKPWNEFQDTFTSKGSFTVIWSWSARGCLLLCFQGRQDAGVEKREKEFCNEYCLSQSTLELVNTTRSNIVGHLRAMGIVKSRGVNDMRDLNTHSKEWVFVKAALVGGLYPNLIFVDRTINKLYSRSGVEL